MVCVKMLPRSECCIIDIGRAVLFSNTGKVLDENACLSKYMDGMIELPILSVLSSNGKTEVACFLPGSVVHKYEASYDVVIKLQMKGGFLRMLQRGGTETLNGEKIPYNQLLLIYREGFNVLGLVQELQLKEI